MRLIIKIVLETVILLITFFLSKLRLFEITGEEGETRTVRLCIIDDGSSSRLETRTFHSSRLID